MREKTLELIEKFEEREKLQLIKVWESKKILFFSSYLTYLVRIDWNFPLIFSTVGKSTVQSNLFPPIISAAPPK